MHTYICPNCKAELESEKNMDGAEATCPGCNAAFHIEPVCLKPKKKKKMLKPQTIAVLVVFAVLFLCGMFLNGGLGWFATWGDCIAELTAKPAKKVKFEKKKTPEELREEQLQSLFNPWSGEHKNLTKAIKAAMNDGASYKHVKTVYWDNKDHLIVHTTYKGSNLFGGISTETVKARVDLDGGFQILDQWKGQ